MSDSSSTVLRSDDAIGRLCDGLRVNMKTGPVGLTVRTRHFNWGLRNREDLGEFVLEIPNKGVGPRVVEFVRPQPKLSIDHKERLYHAFKIEPESAVLWDIVIPEEWRHKGIGSELVALMKAYAKRHGAQRFYAANVQPESEGFFEKVGFVRTADPHWWKMKEFYEDR